MVWPFSPRTRAGASAHPQPFARRMTRLFRRAFYFCLFVSLVFGGYAGFNYVRHFILHSGFFKVTAIEISGASPELEKDARAWLNRQFSRTSDNLCLIGGKFLAAGLGALPRAKSARVRKVFPE